MAWLNYHHLLYFWTVARSGTIAQASKELHLSQPTISTQIKTLEDTLGQKLFQRQGRRLVLTDVGRTTFRYADEIFRVGRELQEALARGPVGHHVRFTVGVEDVVPKTIAYRLLAPAFEQLPELQLECHEGPLPQLMGRLALHELDVVLSEQPAPNDIKVRAFSHRLGQSTTSFLASKSVAALIPQGRKFPQCLDALPCLMPRAGTVLRAELDQWLQKHEVHPLVVAEFDDSALMKVFGARGHGVYTVPSVMEPEAVRQLDAQVLGRASDLTQSFYAISVERRLRHPAVVAVAESARRDLFT